MTDTTETVTAPLACMEHHKLDLIPVSELGLYGFTAQIIDDMKTFEIFPNSIVEDGVPFVHRGDVFGVVRMLLELNMACYHASEHIEKAKEDLAVMLAHDAVQLDPETLKPLEQPTTTVFSAEAQEA